MLAELETLLLALDVELTVLQRLNFPMAVVFVKIFSFRFLLFANIFGLSDTSKIKKENFSSQLVDFMTGAISLI